MFRDNYFWIIGKFSNCCWSSSYVNGGAFGLLFKPLWVFDQLFNGPRGHLLGLWVCTGGSVVQDRFYRFPLPSSGVAGSGITLLEASGLVVKFHQELFHRENRVVAFTFA